MRRCQLIYRSPAHAADDIIGARCLLTTKFDQLLLAAVYRTIERPQNAGFGGPRCTAQRRAGTGALLAQIVAAGCRRRQSGARRRIAASGLSSITHLLTNSHSPLLSDCPGSAMLTGDCLGCMPHVYSSLGEDAALLRRLTFYRLHYHHVVATVVH